MIGTLQNSEIEEMLHTHFIGRIGCHANSTTYVVPISYAYDGAYIYGHSNEGLKLEMMRANPTVCFEVDDMENMANWKSVICQGTFEELKEEKERTTGANVLLNRTLPLLTSSTVKITPHWPFGGVDSNHLKGIIFRIALKEKSGRFEKSDEGYFYAT